MRVKEFSEEVFYATDQIVKVGHDDLEFLKLKAERTPRGRVRVCTHRDLDDKLHEMIVVLRQDAYLRPEKHLVKVESYHIIEGSVDVVIFDEVGNIFEVVQMGEHSSGRRFYYRLSDPLYHTLLIKSERLVYHEAATGPFKKSDAVFAAWAPEETDGEAKKEFLDQLVRKVEDFLSTPDNGGDSNQR